MAKFTTLTSATILRLCLLTHTVRQDFDIFTFTLRGGTKQKKSPGVLRTSNTLLLFYFLSLGGKKEFYFLESIVTFDFFPMPVPFLHEQELHLKACLHIHINRR